MSPGSGSSPAKLGRRGILMTSRRVAAMGYPDSAAHRPLRQDAPAARRCWRRAGAESEEKLRETDFVRFYQTVAGVEVFLYGACMAAFLRPFLEGDGEGGRCIRRKCLLVFFIYVSVFILGTALSLHGWLCMLLVTAALMAGGRFLGIAREFLFLLGLLFLCTRHLSLMAIQSLDFYTRQFFLAEADTPEKVFLAAALNHICIETLLFLLFALMLRGLGARLRKRPLGLHAKELCYLLLTPVTGILFVHITLRLLIVADGDSVFQLYEQVPAAVGIVPLLAALFYAGTLAAIAVCQRTIALQEERSRHFVEQQQLAAIRERLAQVEQLYDGIRRMKHEMRGHLANIRGLAESGCYEDMERYIGKMDESIRILEPGVSTGNAVTDVIVGDAMRTADRLGIDFRADFVFPASGGYDSYDMGIILNNLLRNALEACEKVERGRRYISLSGRKKNRFYLLEVRNSFDGKVSFHRHTGLPVSTKETALRTGSREFAALHGIGLSNVKREAEKYRGNVDIRAEGEEFLVTVLLQEASSP